MRTPKLQSHGGSKKTLHACISSEPFASNVGATCTTARKAGAGMARPDSALARTILMSHHMVSTTHAIAPEHQCLATAQVTGQGLPNKSPVPLAEAFYQPRRLTSVGT